MTNIYNKASEKLKRKFLRVNETETENILWQHLRAKKMMNVKFKRQYSVGSFVLDFYAPSLKLAIEVDGKIHDEKDNKEYDRYREEQLKILDIKFLRFTNEEVINNIVNVLNRISQNITQISKKK